MTITKEFIRTLIHIDRLRHSELDFQRIPMEAEAALMEQIRQGRYQEIQMSPFSKLDDNLGSMASNPITVHTYLVVSAIALFSRTAISAGVTPDDAFDLSDALLYVLSCCKTSDEIHQLYQVAGVMFAEQVHQQNSQKPSYQVERICNYVGRNIYQKITLKDVADYVELSPTYLCNMFSREMGLSLHNYIQQEKVAVACNLLMHSGRPISDIATYMGFQSPSNFAAVFKKWKGMSPSQFREKNYREVY